MPLPTEKTKYPQKMEDLSIFLYGLPKIGKTTWASNAKNALFILPEPGANFLEVYKYPVFEWQDILNAAHELKTEKHNFKTVVIDTIDIAYRLCTAYICQKRKISHPGDLRYGKAYEAIREEFMNLLTSLSHLPYGLIMLGHSQRKEIQSRRTDKVFSVNVPNLPDKIRADIEAFADLIMYADYKYVVDEKGDRLLTRVAYTQTTTDCITGDRTGRMPDVMPLDFKAFEDAFHNPTNKKGKENERKRKENGQQLQNSATGHARAAKGNGDGEHQAALPDS
jgi:hypothetical protein